MTEPKRLGEGYLGDGPSAARPAWCGGALLFIDRQTYKLLERDGVRWATSGKDVPFEGKAHVRVKCDQEALAVMKGGHIVQHGLCASCHAMEERAREVARMTASSTRGDR